LTPVSSYCIVLKWMRDHKLGRKSTAFRRCVKQVTAVLGVSLRISLESTGSVAINMVVYVN
jgi:hypothetical protein